jgi:hypothetical protein
VLACALPRRQRRRQYFEDGILSRLTLYWWNKETQDLEEALGEALDVKSLDPMPVGIFAIAFKSRSFFSFQLASSSCRLIGGLFKKLKAMKVAFRRLACFLLRLFLIVFARQHNKHAHRN